MDRTERDRFGPTRCGPVDDVIKWSTDRHYILLMLIYRHYKLHVHFYIVWLVT